MTYTNFKNNRYKPIPTPLDTIKKHDILSKEEEIKFFELYHSVDDSSIKEEIKETVILSNVRLIMQIVNKRYIPSLRMTKDDLFQEGILGLLTAFDKYDYKSNSAFSTYAFFWIDNFVSKAIRNKNFLVRMPDKWHNHIAKINKIKSTNPDISNKELSEILKIPVNIIENVINFHKIEYSLFFGNDSDDDETQSYLNIIIPNNGKIEQEELIEKEELTQNIQLALSLLTEKERKVIDLRFGFSNTTNKKKQLSLADIGKILNLTHEGVRVIEKRALSKLSNDKVFNLLKDYIP